MRLLRVDRGGLQRLGELLLAPGCTLVELRRERRAQAAPDRRPLGHAGGEQIAPVDREADVAQIPSQARAGSLGSERARQRDQLGRRTARPRPRSRTARRAAASAPASSSARDRGSTIASRSSASNASESSSPRSSAAGTPSDATASTSRSGRPSAGSSASARRASELVAAQARSRVHGAVEPEVRRRSSALTGSRLAGEQPQLGTDARAADRPERAAVDRLAGQRPGARLDLEPEAAGVPDQPKQPGRVVDEAPVVEYPQPVRARVLERARRGSASSPARSPPSAMAIALTVKSRRSRSSSSGAGVDVGERPRTERTSRAGRGAMS